jgi:hypothetical protein
MPPDKHQPEMPDRTDAIEQPQSNKNLTTAAILSIAVNAAAAVGTIFFLTNFFWPATILLVIFNVTVYLIVRQTRPDIAGGVLLGALFGWPLGFLGYIVYAIFMSA